MRKEERAITLSAGATDLRFDSAEGEVRFVKTVVYESLLHLHETIHALKRVTKPEELRKELAEGSRSTAFDSSSFLDPQCVLMEISAHSKDQLMVEMIEMMNRAGKIDDLDTVLKDVRDRENILSTGMQDGLAFPHAKTEGVSQMSLAVGFKKSGIDFSSIDGKASTIFIMILSPKKLPGPHLQLLSSIAGRLSDNTSRERLLSCKNPVEVAQFFGKK